jgi:uncharacterized protein (TIGR00730 family)
VKDYTHAIGEVRDKLLTMGRDEDPALRMAVEKSMAAMAASVEAAQKFGGVDVPVLASFGSAYSAESSEAYQAAQGLNRAMAGHGYGGITGGGPGIMEAANRGMQAGGGLSMGVNLQLPYEQAANPYVDPKYLVVSPEFGNRMDIMEAPGGKPVAGVAIFEGGAGTGQEFWDVVGKIRANKLPRIPINVADREFYDGTRRQLDAMVDRGALSPKVTEYIHYTDSVEAGEEFLVTAAAELAGERAEWMAQYRPELVTAAAGFGAAADARPAPARTRGVTAAGAPDRPAPAAEREGPRDAGRSQEKGPQQGR